MDAWIKSSERLPDEEISCFVVYYPPSKTITEIRSVRVLTFNPHHKCWDTEDGDDYFCDLSDVTHWMPQPAWPELPSE